MNSRPTSSRGFTLVEIALAVSIFAVAMISLIALLNVAIETDTQSHDATALAAMSQYVMEDLRSYPFNSMWEVQPSFSSTRTDTSTLGSPANPTVYYFTRDGVNVPLDKVEGNLDVLYRCAVVKTIDTLSMSSSRSNALKLNLNFNWPYRKGIETAKPRRTIYASLARY